MEFHQTLYMHLYRQDLDWDCYLSFFHKFEMSDGPWLMFLQHEKRYSGDVVRFSDNSSCI